MTTRRHHHRPALARTRRLAHTLVLTEARRLHDHGPTIDGKITTVNLPWVEERATPLAAAVLVALTEHHVDLDEEATRAAVGGLAVVASRIESEQTGPLAAPAAGTTPLAAVARALNEKGVNLNTTAVQSALRALADAIAASAPTDRPGPAPTRPAPPVDAADLLTARASVERTKSTIVNSTALGVAASLVAAVLYGTGLLAGRPASVIGTGIAAVALALAAVAFLVAAVWPRTGSTKPASAAALAAEAEHLAADPEARTAHAATELAVLQRVNATKASLIRTAMLTLTAAAATATAAVLIATL